MRGLTGPSGFNGSKGIQGDQGSSGTQGLQGLQGEKGISGSQGDLGRNGTDGVPGEKGTAGAQGDKGSQGTLGPQGPQGPQGLQGPQGAGNFSLCVYDTAKSTVTAGTNALATVVLTEPEVSNFKSYMYILSKQAFLLTHCIQYFTVFNILVSIGTASVTHLLEEHLCSFPLFLQTMYTVWSPKESHVTGWSG